MFGHQDVLNHRNYTTSVKCISNSASIYCCKAEEFYSIINRDEKSYKILASICDQKDSNLIDNIKRAAKSTEKLNNKEPNLEFLKKLDPKSNQKPQV